MGYYNSKMFEDRLDELLRQNICPISKQPMQPCSPDYKSGFSSFHYICPAIHSKVKIALSGALISNEDNLYECLKSDELLQKRLIELIKSYTGEEFMVATYTVREILRQIRKNYQMQG